MMLYFMLLLVMTFLGSIASLFLKRASGAEGIADLICNIHFYVGSFLYLTSAFLNIYVLRYLDYSVVLPLTSFTYIWTMVFSYFILKEKITGKKVLGVALILVGAVAVSI